MSPRGLVFDISRGCVDDGPGLRTVVFLKGCNLDCPWCHNPEGKARRPEIGMSADRCIACGTCNQVCPRPWRFDPVLGAGNSEWRDGCRACGRCVAACPPRARRLAGREMDASELVDELLGDADYFTGTGGGVSFSGGEPLLQAPFLFECARQLRARDVHVAVETAGLWPSRLVPELALNADLVLFDLKHCDLDKLRSVLGIDCSLILDNLTEMMALDVEIELRLTLVPGFNDSDRDLAHIGEWLSRLPRSRPVRLQRFHRMAIAKAEAFAVDYPYADAPLQDDGVLDRAAAQLRAHGIPVLLD